MFGVKLPTDFSDRIWTTLSFDCSPTYRLASLIKSKAVGSAARAPTAKAATANQTARLPHLLFKYSVFICDIIGSSQERGNFEANTAAQIIKAMCSKNSRASSGIRDLGNESAIACKMDAQGVGRGKVQQVGLQMVWL